MTLLRKVSPLTRTFPISWRFSLLLLALMLGVTFGCSSKGDRPELGQVSGVVKLDGAPLPGVVVAFQPTSGRGSDATTDSEGRYRLNYLYQVPGAKIGSHRVAITPVDDESASSTPLRIPKKYNFETTLEAVVADGENTFDFDLKSK